MEAADRIRHAVEKVAGLRAARDGNMAVAAALSAVKRLQARRFRGTYADLLGQGPYREAARFFLEELYGERDYSERDAQFSRIAGTLQRVFPSQVVGTAVALAELHALTESLDHDMALAWPRTDGGAAATPAAAHYITAWRQIGQAQSRHAQLNAVVSLGRELDRITRLPGLRLMLRMMRGPAAAAGMGDLQAFLEAGFDAFSGMSRAPGGAAGFLRTLEQRERALIDQMFDAPYVACETALVDTLGQAR